MSRPLLPPITGPLIALEGVTYRYPGGVSVGPIDLVVRPGELVLLTGPTGCGKSTVLRLAAGLLQRHGHGAVGGGVRIGDRDPAVLVAAERVHTLGFVGQEPDDSVVSGTCAAELAFGLESAGFSPTAIAARVEELLGLVGLAQAGDRAPEALSGGQRQRLVIGAALAAGARVLLLDEPLSQLDPAGAQTVLALLRGLADNGVAVLCVEHRLEAAMPFATRTVLLAGGRIVADPVRSVAPLRALGLRAPALDELREATGASSWKRREAFLPEGSGRPLTGASPTSIAENSPLAVLSRVGFAWPGAAACLSDISFTVSAGERVALVGANGAGKSTLLGLLAGQLRPSVGTVVRLGRLVDVPQNPDLALFCETVAEELAYGPTEAGRAPAAVATCVDTAAAALSIADLLPRPPQALSRGQRLRTAVGAALTCAPRILALDEPTSGQDSDQVDRLFHALRSTLGRDAVVFASHDLDVVLRHATRVIVLESGRIIAAGDPLPTLVRAAASASGLVLPPLARLCGALGLPYTDPTTLAAQVEPA